jgi:hypothetical protein
MEPLNVAIIRIRLAEISSRLLVVFIAVSLGTCPLLVAQPLFVLQIGFIDFLVALVAWFLIHKHFVTRFSPHLVIVTCFVTVTPLLKEALRQCQFNQRKAARLLDLTYDQLRGYLRKYELLSSKE